MNKIIQIEKKNIYVEEKEENQSVMDAPIRKPCIFSSLSSYYKHTCAPLSKLPSCAPAHGQGKKIGRQW